MSMILLDELREYRERYAALPMRPLRIVCELAAPVAHYHNLHFDAILAFQVLAEATRGRGCPPTEDYYEVPLPLREVWRSEEGVPLYASTDLLSQSTHVQDVVYYHRRALEPTMTPKPLRTTQGRHKEKRTPLPTTVTSALSCDVLGNMDEIGRLLENLTAIGKKHSTLGTVKRWLISPLETFSFVDKDHCARRPLPVLALYGDNWIIGLDHAKHVAFTAPYWHWQSKTMCYDTGQRLPNDVSMELVLR